MKHPQAIELSTNLQLGERTAGLSILEKEWIHPERVLEDSFFLIFVRQGKLHLRVEQEEYHLSTGQTLLICPGQAHCGIQPSEPELHYYWLQFKYDVNEQTISQTIDIPLTATLARPMRMIELFRMLLDDQQANLDKLRTSHQLFVLILSEIADTEALLGKEGDTATRLADRARNYMRTHCDQLLTTPSIASALGCNADYLAKTFRQVFGITIAECARQMRLYMARQLLLESDKTISEIARDCGFRDPNYFGRIFRQVEGMSAGDYRKVYARHYIVSQELKYKTPASNFTSRLKL